MNTITIQGARTHNLKNISCIIPRNKFVVITGLSGSGKSSLAFDTLYAEGQRRYVESLSAYARQFLSLMEKPDVDLIEGLSPAISIEQKSTSHNPRSTVGTITEIYDYLRLLFARVGDPRCPTHHETLYMQSVSSMVDRVLQHQDQRMMILAPVVKHRKGEHSQLFDHLKAKGYIRARINGTIVDIDDAPPLEKNTKNSIDVVVDRLRIKDAMQQRIAESIETALDLADGIVYVASLEDEPVDELVFSAKYACSQCGYSLKELEPRLFSFNNPNGACETCDGIGKQQVFDPDRVVANPELSLNQGAIPGWEPRNHYSFAMITAVCDHYGIDVSLPWDTLSSKQQNIILYGSKNQKIAFSYTSEKIRFDRNRPFEGVIPNLSRRWRETESMAVREELHKLIATVECPDCQGQRLKAEARNVFFHDTSLPSITALSIEQCRDFFNTINLSGNKHSIATPILKEIRDRLGFLCNVGLNYLTLARSADSLSGGEAQRIRLASQIGSGLVGVLYVLDEPSIGLHQRDNNRLLTALRKLRDLGNTVLVVEHDMDAIMQADYVIDIGPKAGVHGGEVVAAGTPQEIAACKNSITGAYLANTQSIAIPKQRRSSNTELSLIGASGNNLTNVDITIPLEQFVCITGVSGSGKSSLINHTLYPECARRLMGATTLKPLNFTSIAGIEHLDKVINIDQSPIGRTPRSNPSTYTGVFTPIRELFALTPEARMRGYKAGRFSFNVKGGRCEHCQGDGVIKVEMHFLADVYVECEHCHGKRYNRETLDIAYKGKNIAEILSLTVEQACEFFTAIPTIKRKLDALMSVGLGYITLGQNATTLSGGEAQRVKLAKELARQSTGNTLYIFDEPTTGLHFYDIDQLLSVMHQLTDKGNSLVVIEHNLDVIKTADWVIDLGPEGGSGGGSIIATGTPETLATIEHSHTGVFLREVLG